MFRRTFWFTTGVATGVWATAKVNRKLRQLTPEHLAVTAANRAIETGHRLKDRAVEFALDVRENMARREAQLDDALGLSAPVDRELPEARYHTAIESRAENRDNPQSVGPDRPARSYNRNEDH